jgi:hypothetical protein
MRMSSFIAQASHVENIIVKLKNTRTLKKQFSFKFRMNVDTSCFKV